MRARPHRTLTPLALAILRLLHERPMHPYEMHQLVRDRGTDFVIKVRAGSLYHAVERLAMLGLIAPVETGRDGRRPERTVYAITDAGTRRVHGQPARSRAFPGRGVPGVRRRARDARDHRAGGGAAPAHAAHVHFGGPGRRGRAGGRRAREIRSRSHPHRRNRIRPAHAAGRADLGSHPDRRYRRRRDRLVATRHHAEPPSVRRSSLTHIPEAPDDPRTTAKEHVS